MQRLVAFLLCLACLSAFGEPRRRAVRAPFDTRRILWIAAHPDDETLIAPLLGRFCVEGQSRCSFLVFTRGEAGQCMLPTCGDLGATRTREMEAAAWFFRAALIQWSLPDAMEGVGHAWDSSAGSHDLLIQRVRAVIDTENPTTIMTFDPAHGSTCHPSHKEVGAVALEAALNESVFFVETVAQPIGASFEFRNAQPGHALAFDASDDWHYLVDAASLHASQFSRQQIDALEATPLSQRAVWLMPARGPVGEYNTTCP